MTSGKPDYANEIFVAMVDGTEAERGRAKKLLEEPDLDREILRIKIIRELESKLYDTKNKKAEHPIAWTKAWLLSTLGRVAEDDPNANKVLADHVDATIETHRWIRYWTLEGLYVSKSKNLKKLVTTIINRDKKPLVSMLAKAIMAEDGDAKALDEIKNALGEMDDKMTQWIALRALRIVPLDGTLNLICNIVKKEFPGKVEIIRDPKTPVISYDAIGALGHANAIPGSADIAGDTIIPVISYLSSSPMYDNLRRKALKVLGKLKLKQAESIITQQLTDDNPAIVRDASWALEETVGTGMAATHVLEAAIIADTKHIQKYASALREMKRDDVIDVLEKYLVTGPMEHRQTVEQLLAAMGGAAAFATLQARKDVMKDYYQIFEKAETHISSYYERSFRNADAGFVIVTTMDIMMFGIGVFLIVVSAYYAMLSEGSLDIWAGVGAGLATGGGILMVLVTRFYKDPRKNVEDTVDHMMLLSLVFFAYHRQLHLVSQGYTRALLEDKPLTSAEVNGYRDSIDEIMEKAINRMMAATRKDGSKKATPNP